MFKSLNFNSLQNDAKTQMILKFIELIQALNDITHIKKRRLYWLFFLGGYQFNSNARMLLPFLHCKGIARLKLKNCIRTVLLLMYVHVITNYNTLLLAKQNDVIVEICTALSMLVHESLRVAVL